MKSMYYVYILKSLKDNKYYIGSSANVEARLAYHNSGRQRSTKHRIPFILVYQESHGSKSQAEARERQIKSYKGSKGLKKLLFGV